MNKLFCIVLLIGFVSCSKDDNKEVGRPPVNEKSYIQGFYELNNFRVSPISGVKVNKDNQTMDLYTSFDAPKEYAINDGIGVLVEIGSEGYGKGLIDWKKNGEYTWYYNELVEKIGDTSYNSKVMGGISGRIIAVADTLVSINITCNKPIDNNHPTGSNLNVLFSIYFEDPVAIIKNGYKPLSAPNQYSLDGMISNFPYTIYGNRLSSINLLEKPHIGVKLFLVLETEPEKTDEYIFTISITNNKGKTTDKTAESIKIKGIN